MTLPLYLSLFPSGGEKFRNKSERHAAIPRNKLSKLKLPPLI